MARKNRRQDPDPELIKRRKRIGAFIRKRRRQLGLSQGDLCRILMYRNRNSISNVELGREGLPLKKVYDYAEALQLPRDDFFQFVIGEMKEFAIDRYQEVQIKDQKERTLSRKEHDLVINFRRLSKKYQDRLLTELDEYLQLEGKQLRRTH